MAKSRAPQPGNPKKPKDPAKPTRAKAARPDVPALDDALADLLNPAIGQGTAGLGSQTGLKPPPDNSWDRRADFADAHRARASTRGFAEPPQQAYTGKSPVPPGELDPDLAKALGIDEQTDEAERGVIRYGEDTHSIALARSTRSGGRPPPEGGVASAFGSARASNRSIAYCARAASNSAANGRLLDAAPPAAAG